jgi:GDP-L-fucose synthase
MITIITGGTGLLGKTLNELEKDYLYLSSKQVDLENRDWCFSYFDSLNPNRIVHLAAKVGGIKENAANPYSFIRANNRINSNVIEYAVDRNLPILFASSSCVYPKKSLSYPMVEEMIYDGIPEETNDGYAYAKRFAGNMLRCAHKQYGLKYTILYFCNLYGEHDSFVKHDKSHLVTALIHRFHQAKIKGINIVELMGTGTPMRQFMYAMDSAKILHRVIEQDIRGEYNVCSNENLTVEEIAKIVADVVEYKGDIVYNGLLDGVFRKDITSDKLLTILGKFNSTTLEEGVRQTYVRYQDQIQYGE